MWDPGDTRTLALKRLTVVTLKDAEAYFYGNLSYSHISQEEKSHPVRYVLTNKQAEKHGSHKL